MAEWLERWHIRDIGLGHSFTASVSTSFEHDNLLFLHCGGRCGWSSDMEQLKYGNQIH
jgi:hypothetical protein